MKTRYLAYFLFLLLPVACKDGLEPSESAIPDHCIEITLANLEPVVHTKTDFAGDDALHENDVYSVDCFFFPAGADENTPAVFQVQGRSAEAITGAASPHYRVRVAFPNSVGEAMFGSLTDGQTCLVYVICNASLDYGATPPTIAQLKAKELSTDFAVQGVQSSFVMSAAVPGVVTLHIDNNDIVTASGAVEVRRSAARIQLYFRIATETHDELNQSWERPAGSQMYVRIVNAAKRGAVDGSYTMQDADYFTTTERPLTELPVEDRIEGKTDYIYTHVPFYSYPLDWSGSGTRTPEIRFRIPWRIKAGGQNVEYRTYRVSPNLDESLIAGNHYYRIFVNVSSLGAREEEDPVWVTDCSYSVMNWINFSISTGGQGDIPADLHTYQYLVVDEPEQTIDNETTARYYYISSSPLVETGASRSKITKVQYIRRTAAGTDMETYTATTDDAINALGITTRWNEWDDDGNSFLEIEHSLSSMYVAWDIEAVIQNADGKTETIKLTQRPPIYIELKDGGEAFIDGYFRYATADKLPFTNAYRMTTGDYNGIYKSVSYIKKKGDSPNNYGYVGTKNGKSTTDVSSGQSIYLVETPYGNLYGTGDMTMKLEKIIATHATTFDTSNKSFSITYTNNSTQSFDFRIGDPRQPSPAGFSLISYLTGMSYSRDEGGNILRYNKTTQDWSADIVSAIMLGSTRNEDINIIAPYFLISSGVHSTMANSGTCPTFEMAQKRCASYQEGGYPAGRWRLPTMAEIAFIIRLQDADLIPTMFNAQNGNYWMANGYLFDVGKVNTNPANNTTAGVRCVYDAWYWGDTPPLGDNSYKYTPML